MAEINRIKLEQTLSLEDFSRRFCKVADLFKYWEKQILENSWYKEFLHKQKILQEAEHWANIEYRLDP